MKLNKENNSDIIAIISLTPSIIVNIFLGEATVMGISAKRTNKISLQMQVNFTEDNPRTCRP